MSAYSQSVGHLYAERKLPNHKCYLFASGRRDNGIGKPWRVQLRKGQKADRKRRWPFASYIPLEEGCNAWEVRNASCARIGFVITRRGRIVAQDHLSIPWRSAIRPHRPSNPHLQYEWVLRAGACLPYEQWPVRRWHRRSLHRPP